MHTIWHSYNIKAKERIVQSSSGSSGSSGSKVESPVRHTSLEPHIPMFNMITIFSDREVSSQRHADLTHSGPLYVPFYF